MSTITFPLSLTSHRVCAPFRLGHRPALDGIRALAVLLVLLHHIEFIRPQIPTILSGGFVGVDLFFVLSGFLITSLLLEEFRANASISLPRFYMRRALRLLPAVAAALTAFVTAGLILGAPAVGLTPLRVGSVIFYFTNWVRAFETAELWLLAHFWSLAIEEQFYLVWPLVLFTLLRRGFSYQKIVLITALTALASILLMAMFHARGVSTYRIYSGSDTRGHALLIGCLLGLFLHAGLRSTVLSVLLQNERRIARLGYVSLSLFLIASFVMSFGSSVLYRGGFALIAVCAALLILSLLFSSTGWLYSGMTSPVAVWIGKRSYGLYVWHWPVYHLLAISGAALSFIVPAAVVLTFVVAALSYRFIESPFLKIKGRYSRFA